MKHIRLILLVVLTMLLAFGCSKKNGSQNEIEEETEVVTENVTENVTEQKESTQEEQSAPVDTEPKNPEVVRIAALKGPTAIGMVKIMEDAENNTAVHQYDFHIAGAADEITAGLIQGEFDVAAVPCNLASVLYNKTEGKIKLAGINTLGVLYIVETGETIGKVEDLRGKTIYSTGFGTTPQYTLEYLLKANGIDPTKDVTIEYKTEATEVAAILNEATDAVAMLPQPFVTSVMMNNDKIRIALDVAEEWSNISNDGSSVVTGVVVVRNEFLESNRDAFDSFMKEYEKSTNFVNENIEEASSLVEKYEIFKAAVAKQAIPYCNITMLRDEEMKEKVRGYLNALYQQNPQSVGGKLPEDDFYYMP